MSHKSFSPVLPSYANPPLRKGFTTWVELPRSTASAVRCFRQSLDDHLASHGLVRSMNPLHMLVWSPERCLTADDQLTLLHWMLMLGDVERVGITALHSHVGIPSELRAQKLQVSLSDAAVQSVLLEHRYCGRSAASAMAGLQRATARCA